MKPKLSICIPTYNRAKYLGETIASIVNQATEEVEIVISDNASSDNTTEIVEHYRATFPSIVYYRHSENVGADRNYLKVVELASGEYCWLFGSDDIMKEHAIAKVLSEIKSGADVYLCGLTLCTLDMAPIEKHRVLKIETDKTFNLSNEQERHSYFELAETTTAFFSFLGSLIVRKKRWDAVEIDEGLFIGSLWSHVGKIFGMMPDGLIVKYLCESLLNKRGDNDSFVNNGMVRRYEVAISGYRKIADTFFGANSVEAFHIRRTVRNELTIRHLLNAKLDCVNGDLLKDKVALDRLVAAHYSDPQLSNRINSLVYKTVPMFVYRYVKLINNQLKNWSINGEH